MDAPPPLPPPRPFQVMNKSRFHPPKFGYIKHIELRTQIFIYLTFNYKYIIAFYKKNNVLVRRLPLRQDTLSLAQKIPCDVLKPL